MLDAQALPQSAEIILMPAHNCPTRQAVLPLRRMRKHEAKGLTTQIGEPGGAGVKIHSRS